MHLAEETALLKDQVDALRELSVQVLKEDSSNYRSSFPPSSVVLDSPVNMDYLYFLLFWVFYRRFVNLYYKNFQLLETSLN